MSKFKIGDTIERGNFRCTIIDISEKFYHVDNRNAVVPIVEENEWKLINI